jgi:hypothetical protein
MARSTNGVNLPVTQPLGNGASGDNEGPSQSERVVPAVSQLNDGPVVNPETGAYMPAAYQVLPGIVRIDR